VLVGIARRDALRERRRGTLPSGAARAAGSPRRARRRALRRAPGILVASIRPSCRPSWEIARRRVAAVRVSARALCGNAPLDDKRPL